jgi:hypothetical protein
VWSAVIQVLSRYWALWGIVEVAPEATSTGALTLLKADPVTLQLNMITLLFCWSVTEVLRYGFYAVKVKTLLTMDLPLDIAVHCQHIFCMQLSFRGMTGLFGAGTGHHAIPSPMAALLHICDSVPLGSCQRDDNGVPSHASHPQGAAAQFQHAQQL